MGFSRQEYWSGLPLPSLEDLPDPGIKHESPVLQMVTCMAGGFLTNWATREALKCSTWVKPQKQQKDLSSFQRQIIQCHCNSNLCPYHWCWRWSSPVLWKHTASSRINNKRKENVLLIIGICNAKVGSQEISGVVSKFGLAVKNEVGQRLTEFCQENMLVIVCFQTTQETSLQMDITRWSVLKSGWLCSL